MPKKNTVLIIFLIMVAFLTVLEWKWMSICLCLYIVVCLLMQEIKGIEE